MSDELSIVLLDNDRMSEEEHQALVLASIRGMIQDAECVYCGRPMWPDLALSGYIAGKKPLRFACKECWLEHNP